MCESDHYFPGLVTRLAAGVPLAGIPDLVMRAGEEAKLMAPPDRIHDIDALPDPDFEDYFAEIRRGPLAGKLNPSLPIETARGCWRGGKTTVPFAA